MAGKITTLYINDTSIRVLVASGKRIVKLAEVPLDMSPEETTSGVRGAELTAKLKQLFKANNLGTTKVILGLSGLHCLSRPATLPNLPWAMVDEAMLREAERVLPVSIDQLYVSWQVLGSTEENMQAFMIAVPRQVADPVLNVMNELGIKPYLMDIKPLALARLVPEPNAIMLDVQDKNFDVVIINEGVPQPIRSVPLPNAGMSLAEKLAIVRDEILRTIQFYNGNYPEKPVNPGITLYVSGEIAEEPEMFESLENELGYRVEPLISPLKCSKHLDPSNYLINVGLALKEFGREAGPLLPNINILPEPYRHKPISMGKMLALPAIAIAVGIIAVLGMTIQDAAANIVTMQNKLDSTNLIIEQRQVQKKELNDSIAALEANIADIDSQRNGFVEAYEFLGIEVETLDNNLDAVVNKAVPGLRIDVLSVSSADLASVSGDADSEIKILEYGRALDNTGLFSEVIINSTKRSLETGDVPSLDDEDSFTYTISLNIEED